MYAKGEAVRIVCLPMVQEKGAIADSLEGGYMPSPLDPLVHTFVRPKVCESRRWEPIAINDTSVDRIRAGASPLSADGRAGPPEYPNENSLTPHPVSSRLATQPPSSPISIVPPLCLH